MSVLAGACMSVLTRAGRSVLVGACRLVIGSAACVSVVVGACSSLRLFLGQRIFSASGFDLVSSSGATDTSVPSGRATSICPLIGSTCSTDTS